MVGSEKRRYRLHVCNKLQRLNRNSFFHFIQTIRALFRITLIYIKDICYSPTVMPNPAENPISRRELFKRAGNALLGAGLFAGASEIVRESERVNINEPAGLPERHPSHNFEPVTDSLINGNSSTFWMALTGISVGGALRTYEAEDNQAMTRQDVLHIGHEAVIRAGKLATLAGVLDFFYTQWSNKNTYWAARHFISTDFPLIVGGIVTTKAATSSSENLQSEADKKVVSDYVTAQHEKSVETDTTDNKKPATLWLRWKDGQPPKGKQMDEIVQNDP